MKIDISKENFLGIKNPDWWTQECPAVLQLCYGFMTGFAKIGKYFKKDYGAVLVLFKKDYGAHYLDKKKSTELAESVFVDFVENQRSLTKIIRHWRPLRRKLLSIQHKIEQATFKSFITTHQIELLKLALVLRNFEPLDLSNTRLVNY